MRKIKEDDDFFKADITEIVNIIIENNNEKLTKNKKYKHLVKKINTLHAELEETLPKDVLKKVNKLTYLYEEIELYTNTLAYFLGTELGDEINSH